MKPLRPVLAAGLLLLAAGCIRKHIEVTVEPRPDGSFVRTLRLWNTDDEKGDAVLAPEAGLLANAAKHYMERTEDAGAAARFQGTLYAVPPNILDQGQTNQGGYSVWTSPLGHLGYYRERRPGRLDLRARLQEAEVSLDLVVRLAIALARQQLEGEAGLDKLVAYLDGPLRRDLKEAAFLFFVQRLKPIPDEDADEETDLAATAALALQFAEERGHLKVKDLPKLWNDQGRAEFILGLVAARMERPLDDALRAKLAWVADEEKLKAAFEKALPALGMTQEQFVEALKPALECVLAFDLFATHPALRITLRLPPDATMHFTSGDRDQAKNQIVWKTVLTPRPVGGLFFALWSAPDTAWQTQHFGRVALRGEVLEEYVAWEQGLDPAYRKAWHAALGRLDPRGNLEEQLRAIHLGPQTLGEEPQPEEGALRLLDALTEPPPLPPAKDGEAKKAEPKNAVPKK